MQFPQLGTDIHLDSQGQFILGADGDLALCEDLTCLQQGIVHRLMTPLGGLFYDELFGLDLAAWLHRDSTQATRSGLCALVAEQIRLDPRVLRISVRVTVDSWDEKGVVLRARYAWIDGTTTENLVVFLAEDAQAIIPYAGEITGGPNMRIDDFIRETPAGETDGENKIFSLSRVPIPATLQLFVRGVLRVPGEENDYVLDGQTVTLADAPLANDAITAIYIRSRS